jgi:hypothetical protein
MPVSSPTPPADQTMPISSLSQGDLTMPISSQQADETMPFRIGTGFPSGGAGTAAGGTTYPGSGAPSGVGGSGGSGQPFGSRPGAGGVPSAGTGMYGSGTGQSGEGRVYGGLADYAPADMTMPVTTNAVDNSGSLTGHILSQGWREQQAENHRKNNTKVVVAMLIVLGALVGVSLLFVFTVGSAFSDLVGGIFK